MRSGSDFLKAIKARSCAIYIGGERVDDVTTHPAFANAAKTAAKLYDISSDPANAERLTHQIPGSKTRYNNIWLLPRNRADIDARNRVHETWSQATWGLFGRSPDHVAGWICGMACCPQMLDVHGDGFAANVTKYFELARENDLSITYAIVPPASVKSADSVVTVKQTSLPTSNWGASAGLQVVGERDNGIVVSGFKVLATAAILSDEILFGNFQSLAEGQERFAATFALPVDSPGVTLLSRRPFAQLATSELDDPLAWRYDETDAVVHCENVLVPWERVFTYNRVDMARAAFADTPAHVLGNVQAHIRLLTKLRFILGVMKKVTDANGILAVPAVRDILAELAMYTAMVEGLVAAENANLEDWPGGYVAQDRQAMYATMAWTTRVFPQLMEIVRRLLGSHSFQQPADISVFDNEVTAELYSRFTLQPKETAIERYKLMRLAWDLVGSEFASRHTQYEMFYNGAPHVALNRVWHFFRWDKVDPEVDRALKSIGSYEDLVGKGRTPQAKRPVAVGG
ncbi:MAG: 4-hydroxyphenylacetate 3-hydroxylase family protein [Xanthobacteraceae bacterium]